MPQDYFKLNCRAALMAAIASAYPVIGYTAPAAQVDFAVGNVTAVGANGQSRALAKGAQIEQGDTVNTNGGRAQLRFTDGAYVSLQPESQFRIDQYRYDGKQDGNEKGFFSLLKGGLRTITGLVGRTNKSNYQVTTSVATIGIRGTEYTIQYGQSITGAVGEGQIEVCNGGGCLSVTNGESYYVQGQEFKPVLTNKRSDLPPPPPDAPPQAFKEGENVDDTGVSCIFVDCSGPAVTPTILKGTIEPSNVALVTRTSFLSGGESPVTSFNAHGDLQENTSATLSESGVLNKYNQSSPADSPVVLVNPVAVGNDGIIAWGTASSVTGGEFDLMTGNTFSTVHWAVGAPVSNTAALAGLVGSYSLIGATTPTSVTSGQDGGTLISAVMTINFGSSQLDGKLDMNWTLRGVKDVIANLDVFGSGSTFHAESNGNSPNGATAFGFFAGTNAVRAGLVYQVDVNVLEESFIGAAALGQTSLGAPGIFTGTGTAHVGVTGGEISTNVYLNRTVTLDSSGLLTQFHDGDNVQVNVIGPIADAGNDGIIAWGRASGATGGESGNFNTGSHLHYVVGAPADISQIGGMIGTYTLLGATKPMGINSGQVEGTLNSMSMTADFSTAAVSGAMAWTLRNSDLQAAGLTATFLGSMSGGQFSASGPTSSSSGSVNLTGFFAGANAVRAGVVYSVHDPIFSSETFVGAAALKQIGLVQSSSQSSQFRAR